MEAIGQLTGGVAHDFNNLLQAAAGNLDLAQSAVRRGETERADRLLSNAARALGRGSQLTAQLLSFSQRQILRAERVRLSALVTEMVELLRITTPGAVTLRTQSAEALWPVYLDAAQFSSAILNLVINSRDAMPNGGEIAIELCNVTLSKSQAAVMEPAWGDYVRVDVADTGTGMTPEIAEHVFDLFSLPRMSVAARPRIVAGRWLHPSVRGRRRIAAVLGKGTGDFAVLSTRSDNRSHNAADRAKPFC